MESESGSVSAARKGDAPREARREIDTMTDVRVAPPVDLFLFGGSRCASRGSRRSGDVRDVLHADHVHVLRGEDAARAEGREPMGIGAWQPARDEDVRRRHVAGRESGIVLRDLPDPASAAEAGSEIGREPASRIGPTHTDRRPRGCRVVRAATAARWERRGIADDGVDRSRVGDHPLRPSLERKREVRGERAHAG